MLTHARRYEEKVLSRWPEIFVGCLAFVLIVIGIITWRCCVARRRRRALAAQHANKMGLAPGGGKTYNLVSGQASDMHLQEMSSKQGYDHTYSYKPGSV